MASGSKANAKEEMWRDVGCGHIAGGDYFKLFKTFLIARL